MIIPGGQISEKVIGGKVTERQYQSVDTDELIFCWRHSPTLTSDWKNPSPEDKNKLDKIRLKEYEVWDKDKLVKARFCPKCLQTVYYTKPQ